MRPLTSDLTNCTPGLTIIVCIPSYSILLRSQRGYVYICSPPGGSATVTVHFDTLWSASATEVLLGLLLLARLATSDPPLPLHLCFTADRRSARAPPARVIYDQQLPLQHTAHTAGCQMWAPCKQKHIWQPNISRELWTEWRGRRREEGEGGESERRAKREREVRQIMGEKCMKEKE